MESSHINKIPNWAGTMIWTDHYGNSQANIITDNEHEELIVKNVEYLLYDGGRFVGYEYKTEVDIEQETE